MIKYRGYCDENKTWVTGDTFVKCDDKNYRIIKFNYPNNNDEYIVHPLSIGITYGTKDKNGIEVYVSIPIDGKLNFGGDNVQWYEPEIEYQTHTGNNIPNGSYSEPIGVMIKTYGGRLATKDYCYVLVLSDFTPQDYPFNFDNNVWTKESIIERIEPCVNFFDEPVNSPNLQDDLDYLIHDCAKVNSIEELCDYLTGFTVESKQWDLEENREEINVYCQSFDTKTIELLDKAILEFREKYGKDPVEIQMNELTKNLLCKCVFPYSYSSSESFRQVIQSYNGIRVSIYNSLKLNRFELNPTMEDIDE